MMRIAIMAGEHSGDRLGADLMQQLDVEFEGIGGNLMQKAGLSSLFDMEELAVMGIVEVLPKARHLLRRVRESAEFVLEGGFDALITIDSPDFSHRVAKKVKSIQPNFPIIHYVAPSVWAWRPKRAEKMAHHVDHVLCLLPFEPPYMEAEGMSADFVGHPVSRQKVPKGLKVWGKANEGVLGLFPGSRKSEISNHINVYREFLEALPSDLPVKIPIADYLFDEVSEKFQHIENISIFSPSFGEVDDFELEKQKLIYGADMAVCTSGTISLELAWADRNTIVGYKTNPLNAWLYKRMIKIKYASLANILLGEMVIPEFLLENFTSQNLLQSYQNLYASAEARAAQLDGFARMRQMMIPDMDAAQSVMQFLERRA